MPPVPPPAFPEAPGSGWFVVFNVATLRLLLPSRLISPSISAEPATRIVQAFGPWITRVPLAVTSRFRMSTRPLTTVSCAVCCWLMITVKDVSRITCGWFVWLGGKSLPIFQSKVPGGLPPPPGPPVPSKANPARRRPLCPHVAREEVSSREPVADPPTVNSSFSSSAAAPGVDVPGSTAVSTRNEPTVKVIRFESPTRSSKSRVSVIRTMWF